MAETPLTRVVSALEQHGCQPRLRGAGGRALCPTHPDRVPSLVFGIHRNGVRVRCFVPGCDWKAILAALGLQPRDLYDGPRQPQAASGQEIVASYAYTFDADGTPLVERVRFGPVKAFAWRTRQPGGPWRYGLHGASVGLYRADHLIDHRLILITEGEKAAEAGVGLGFAATCGPWGSSAWSGDFTETIWKAGAHVVVVLPDQDVPGRTFAERVAASCAGYWPSLDPPSTDSMEPWASWPSAEPDDDDVQPLRVKLLPLPNLPPCGDLHDWVAAGGTASALADLISTTPDWTPRSPDETRQRTRERTRARVARFRARRRALQVDGHADGRGNAVTPVYKARTYVRTSLPSILLSDRYRYIPRAS